MTEDASGRFEERRAIAGFDHVAVPIDDVDAMLAFYADLGFTIRRGGRVHSAHIGDHRINFHDPELWRDPRFTLKGPSARPGCGDFCFRWDAGADDAAAMLERLGVAIVEGPAPRTGGRDGGETKGVSVYCRDPDGNLIEFISYP